MQPGFFIGLYSHGGENFRRVAEFARPAVACPAGDATAYSNNFATTLAWRPKSRGWIPSINLGWGYSALTQAAQTTIPGFNQAVNRAASQS